MGSWRESSWDCVGKGAGGGWPRDAQGVPEGVVGLCTHAPSWQHFLETSPKCCSLPSHPTATPNPGQGPFAQTT